jgi:hypothetical protein
LLRNFSTSSLPRGPAAPLSVGGAAGP